MRFHAALAVLLFLPAMGRSCELPATSDWFKPLPEIVRATDTIFVGRVENVQNLCGPKDARPREGCYESLITVLRGLKGSIPPGTKVQIRAQLEKQPKDKLKYNKSCDLMLGFNEKTDYLIMLGAFHPDAYRRIEGNEDPWEKSVKDAIAQ